MAEKKSGQFSFVEALAPQLISGNAGWTGCMPW